MCFNNNIAITSDPLILSVQFSPLVEVEQIFFLPFSQLYVQHLGLEELKKLDFLLQQHDKDLAEEINYPLQHNIAVIMGMETGQDVYTVCLHMTADVWTRVPNLMTLESTKSKKTCNLTWTLTPMKRF